MPAGDAQVFRLHCLQIYALLGLCNRGCRLYGDAEYDGHAVCDAAEYAARVIGEGLDSPVPDGERIVVITSPHIRCGKACAEFNALDGRNGKDRAGADRTLSGVLRGGSAS